MSTEVFVADHFARELDGVDQQAAAIGFADEGGMFEQRRNGNPRTVVRTECAVTCRRDRRDTPRSMTEAG